LDQFHGLVLAATVQRANIYRASATEPVRNAFRAGLRRGLDEYAAEYATTVPSDAHVRHIATLADRLSRNHTAALVEGRFRIGPAQKALNLHLKYLWAAGWIPEPPHCPFDAIVIAALPLRSRISWTALDSVAGYQRLVAAAEDLAAPLSLAEWEMREYEKRSPGSQRATRLTPVATDGAS